MSDPAIKGVCAEARRYNFQLLSDYFQLLPVASSDKYMDQCQKIFEDAKAFQRQMSGNCKLQLLTASHIRQIGSFAKRHGMGVAILGYDAAFGSTFAVSAKTLRLSPRAPLLMPEPKWVKWALDHEYGHIRDRKLISTYAPELKDALKTNRWTISGLKKYISTMMEIMRAGLSKSDQVEFDRLQKEVLGNLDEYNTWELVKLAKWIGEYFRRGEEILDERFEDYMMDDRSLPLKISKSDHYYHKKGITNHKGELIDLKRIYAAAPLQEANLWNRFTQLPNYRPNSLRHIKPDHLRFFRLCVRGASRYFINTAAR